jgi:hypothetical protein
VNVLRLRQEIKAVGFVGSELVSATSSAVPVIPASSGDSQLALRWSSCMLDAGPRHAGCARVQPCGEVADAFFVAIEAKASMP